MIVFSMLFYKKICSNFGVKKGVILMQKKSVILVSKKSVILMLIL